MLRNDFTQQTPVFQVFVLVADTILIGKFVKGVETTAHDRFHTSKTPPAVARQQALNLRSCETTSL